MNNISLNLIVISLCDDKEFHKTNISVFKFIEKCNENKDFEKMFFNLIHVISESQINRNLISNQFKSQLDNYCCLISQDNSLYDAMNIAIGTIKEKNIFSPNHISLFLNSGSELIFSDEFIDFILNMKIDPSKSSKRSSSLFFTGANVINRDTSNIKKIWWPSEVNRFLPFKMPASHQAIFYRSNVLIHFPFLNVKGFLASDFLQICSILNYGYKSESKKIITVNYSNNGLSFNNPIRSITQRFVARFIFKDGRNLTLFLLIYHLSRELVWRILFFLKR